MKFCDHLTADLTSASVCLLQVSMRSDTQRNLEDGDRRGEHSYVFQGTLEKTLCFIFYSHLGGS